MGGYMSTLFVRNSNFESLGIFQRIGTNTHG